MILISLTLAGGPTETLRSELARRPLPMPPAAEDLDREITSYSVLDDRDVFAIAYYVVEGDRLLHELRIRAWDRRTGRWTYATHRTIGSVLRIGARAGFLYVSGHSSPSAAPTLVLDGRLSVRRELDGWIELVMEDGRLIFQRSMTHFQPAHAGVLAIYNPRTNVERTFYPLSGRPNDRGSEWVSPTRALAVDRAISEISQIEPQRIGFTVVTQTVDASDTEGRPAEPERRLRVTCDVTAELPKCVESSMKAVSPTGGRLSGEAPPAFSRVM